MQRIELKEPEQILYDLMLEYYLFSLSDDFDGFQKTPFSLR